MLDCLRCLLGAAKRDEEVYTIIRVAVRAGIVNGDEACNLGAKFGIDYPNWHGEGIPGCRV